MFTKGNIIYYNIYINIKKKLYLWKGRWCKWT